MKRIPVLSALLVLVLSGSLFAASAVYICENTGAIGYSYNATTEQQAKDVAKQTCIEYGGTSPILNNSCPSGGYGVVMIGHDSSGRRWVASVLCGTDYQSGINACADALAGVGATYDMSYDKFQDTH